MENTPLHIQGCLSIGKGVQITAYTWLSIGNGEYTACTCLAVCRQGTHHCLHKAVYLKAREQTLVPMYESVYTIFFCGVEACVPLPIYDYVHKQSVPLPIYIAVGAFVMKVPPLPLYIAVCLSVRVHPLQPIYIAVRKHLPIPIYT